MRRINQSLIKTIAAEEGFALAGATAVLDAPDFARYAHWTERGLAGRMTYLSDHRAAIRSDLRNLLPSAQSVICVGKLYNSPVPYSTTWNNAELGWIARYAWGEDYHGVLRRGLERLARRLDLERFRVCVDTAPVLERSYARLAGLGWIGKNTCLINEKQGSWFFLGELLTELECENEPEPLPNRCGSCTRCIEACPTRAIVPGPQGGWELDARLCISYFTIELRGTIPDDQRASIGRNIFGCDICQDVCPWNRRAPVAPDLSAIIDSAPDLERLSGLSEQSFRSMFHPTPVERARYQGFLRNVAVAMGNSGLEKYRRSLVRLAASDDAVVSEHAAWALRKISG